MVLLQLLLHNGPQVLDGVQVRGISRPVHDSNSLLSQKSHDFLTGVTQCPVLKEVGGAVNLHEGEEFLVQQRHVSVAIHRRLQWQEEDGASAALAAKAGPHHHVHGVFHFDHREFLLIPAGEGRPSDLLGSWVDDGEGRFIGKHESFTVFGRPGLEPFAEGEPFFHHLLCQKRLFCCRS